jgi:regulator-associated protein of mTOR
MKVIRMYDAGNETLVADYSARSGSPITSLTSDQVAGHYFIAGFGDGAVRAYDTRLDSRNPLVRAWKQHKNWIVNVHMQRGGIRELVTGSIAGEVRLFEYCPDSCTMTDKQHPIRQTDSDYSGPYHGNEMPSRARARPRFCNRIDEFEL